MRGNARQRLALATVLSITLGASCAVGAESAFEAQIRQAEVEVDYEAVGSIRAKAEARVMAQASGRILTVAVREGESVIVGREVARIEDREVALRVSQAREGLNAAEAQKQQAEEGKVAAEAGFAQARAEYDRVKGFLAKGAATLQQKEQAESAFRQARAAVAQAKAAVAAAEAGFNRAKQGLEEVEVVREYTRVKAPIGGVVLARTVDPGDLAWPGRPLLTIADPTFMRLEAHVPEGLARYVQPGKGMVVHVDALRKDFHGTVVEVVPTMDPVSRTFIVKVSLPTDERLVSGMFGRLKIPMGVRPALLVPKASVRQVGQLRMVQVREKDRWVLRLVRVGRRMGTHYEVLAGLRTGEIVRIDEGKK